MLAKRLYIPLASALLLMAAALPAAAGLYEWSRLARLEGTSGPEPAVSALAAHPTDPAILYAGVLLTTDGADLVYRSADGGQSWRAVASGLPDDLPANTGVEDLVVTPGDPVMVYAAIHQNGVWRSDDGGATWNDFSGGGIRPDDTVLVLLATTGPAPTLYALTTDGIHQRPDKWIHTMDCLLYTSPSPRD